MASKSYEGGKDEKNTGQHHGVGQDMGASPVPQTAASNPQEREAILHHLGTMSDKHLHIAHHAAVTARHNEVAGAGPHTAGFLGSMAEGTPQNVAPNYNSTQPSPSPTPPSQHSQMGHMNPADIHEKLFGGGMSSMPTAAPSTKRAKPSGPGAPGKPQSKGGYGY